MAPQGFVAPQGIKEIFLSLLGDQTPARTLSEPEFNAIRESVIAAAPAGLDEAAFQKYYDPALAQAVAIAEKQPTTPDQSSAPNPLLDKLKWLESMVAGGLGMDPNRTDQYNSNIVGAAKGVAGVPVFAARMVHKIPYVSPGVDALYGAMERHMPGVSADATAPPMDSHTSVASTADESVLGLQANNRAEWLGKLLEQLAEYGVGGMGAEKLGAQGAAAAVPYLSKFAARVVPRMATNAGATALVGAKQGKDVPIEAAVGAVTPFFPEAATGVGQFLRGKAEASVIKGVKPTVASMRRVAGASVMGIDKVAQRLAQFILDNRLTSPEKAQAIIDGVEAAIPKLFNDVGNPISDAAARAARYLKALGRSAAKQGLPAEDVAIIQGKMKDLLNGPLGKDVTTMAPKLTATGRTTGPVKTRALRTDVRAKEALDIGRATSKWSTKKSYGEMKGAAMEADKAVNRGTRDAAKRVVPALKPLMNTESQAIQAREALTRMKFRQANRDAVSLPAHVLAAGEVASGHAPVLAFASNWLRNNPLKAGIWTDRLANAIKKKQVQQVITILGRLGVRRGFQERGQAPSR